MTKDKIIEDYLAREDRYEAFFDIIAPHLKKGTGCSSGESGRRMVRHGHKGEGYRFVYSVP